MGGAALRSESIDVFRSLADFLSGARSPLIGIILSAEFHFEGVIWHVTRQNCSLIFKQQTTDADATAYIQLDFIR